MKFRLGITIASLVLLVGCGGGSGGFLVQGGSAPKGTLGDNDPLLAEESEANGGAYASGGAAWDPSREEELQQWERQIKFDVPIQVNSQVKSYLVYFSTKRKEIVRGQLARSSRYLPMIKKVFQEYGLPEDLAYIAMVESGFNPRAQSPAGASGLWQFIKGTGLRYGLVINDRYDERLDPVKSTHAAAKYLLDLYKQFGSWYLAAASYNCGERRVQQELNKTKHENFWQLSANRCLPGETKNYVPQIIAATIIAKNPDRFGFTNIAYQPPLDEVRVADLSPTPNSGGRVNQTPASRPRHLVTAQVVSYAPPQSGGAAAAAHRTTRSSKHPAATAQKPAPPRPYARNSHPAAHKSSDGKAAPQLASMFGTAAPAKKDSARKMGAPKQSLASHNRRQPAKVAHSQGKKPSPAIFAKKHENKTPKTKLAKKQGPAAGHKTSAKPKSKALLMSEVR